MYLTPNGAKGFLPHTDQHDFFILQTGGKKKWRVYGNPIPLNTRNQEQGKKSGKPLREKDLGGRGRGRGRRDGTTGTSQSVTSVTKFKWVEEER